MSMLPRPPEPETARQHAKRFSEQQALLNTIREQQQKAELALKPYIRPTQDKPATGGE